MKSLSILKTQSNNHYLLCSSSKFNIYIPPIVLFFLKNNREKDFENNALPKQLLFENHLYDTEEIEYYFRKYLFLKQSGFLAERDKPSAEKLSGIVHKDRLQWQMSNLTQLVFEVTDSCNLNCKYCCYGDLYSGNKERNNKFMLFETARTVIDYFTSLWMSDDNHSMKKKIRIGFYGGEPLLNMDLIKRVIEYIDRLQLAPINFTFGMTTNGMLLDKYMDYLVEKDFDILVSLDGNKLNQSYRVLHNGSNSFEKIYMNLQLLRSTYPSYFNANVNFSSVLHNRNSVSQIYSFIKTEFGKDPRIAELNPRGVARDKWREFVNLYKNTKMDLQESDNYEQIQSDIGLNNVDFSRAVKYIHTQSGNIFKRYSDLLRKGCPSKYIPTGTCTPFERKMFVTVTGNLIPCERMGQNYYFGEIINNKVELDFEKIAKNCNTYLEKLKKQCICCYLYSDCPQCIYQIEDLEGDPVCNRFMNANQYDEYSSEILSYIEQNPEVYKKAFDIFFE